MQFIELRMRIEAIEKAMGIVHAPVAPAPVVEPVKEDPAPASEEPKAE